MTRFFRAIRWLLAIALAGTIGTLPACGSMGGGMKYLIDVPALLVTS